MLDELMKRKIPAIDFKCDALEIRCNLPVDYVAELPGEVRRALIDSPLTPGDLKDRLVREEDADLFGAT